MRVRVAGIEGSPTALSDPLLTWQRGRLIPKNGGERSAEVPGGSEERIVVGYIGAIDHIYPAVPPHKSVEEQIPTIDVPARASSDMQQFLGIFATYPLEQEELHTRGMPNEQFIWREPYRLTFTITSQETTAVRYAARLSFALNPPDGPALTAAKPRWGDFTPLRRRAP